MSDTEALTKKDFQSDQEARWCPGCGDYAILSAVQAVCADLGFDQLNFDFRSKDIDECIRTMQHFAEKVAAKV